MNANLVKYGKYGAVALVVGLGAYMLIKKNKKSKAEAAALAVVEAAKKEAEAKSAALKAAAEKKYSTAIKPMKLAYNPAVVTMTDSEF